MRNFMAFFFVNSTGILAIYSCVSRWEIQRVSTKIIFIGILFSAQIVLTQLILGLCGLLDSTYLLLLNTGVSLGLLILNVHKRTNAFVPTLRNDIRNMITFGKSMLSGANLFFSTSITLLVVWFSLASFLLPPRGVDDLGYHLPPVYEAVRNHELSLLPVAYMPYFAYPGNAELFKLWPTIFFHNIHWIGMVPFIFAFWAVVIIYSLARSLRIDQRSSFFISVQFLFAPVVLAQMGSGYIEVITTAFFLAALYLSVQFHSNGKDRYLYLLGITFGLMLGMKYSMLLLVSSIAIFLIPGILRKSRRSIVLFLSLVFVCGGYWYLRNAIALGNPWYPMALTQSGLGVFDIQKGLSFQPLEFFLVNGKKFYLFFTKDLGIRTFHGGLGIVFWGIAFPCRIYVFAHAVRRLLRKEIFPFFLWVQLITGMVLIVLIPIEKLRFNVRQSLFMIPIALLAFGEVLQIFRARWIYRKFLALSCCVAASFSLIGMAGFKLPSYEVDVPIQDILKNKEVSQNRYLQLSSYMPEVSCMWEALDFLTRDDQMGLSCYYASDPYFFWSAPIYGTHLQNSVWNFQKDISKPPEALIFYFGPLADVFYLDGKKITLEDALEDKNYTLVASTKASFLFIEKNFFEKEEKRRLLTRFYQDYLSSEIDFFQDAIPVLDAGVPIIASSNFGMLFRYFHMIGELSNPVYLVPNSRENEFVRNQNFHVAYTINRTLEGFHPETVYETIFANQPFVIYKNAID